MVGPIRVTFRATAVVPEEGMESTPVTVTSMDAWGEMVPSAAFWLGRFSDAQKEGLGVWLQRVSARRRGETGVYSAGAVGELVGTKVNLSSEEVAEVPAGLVTVMSTVTTPLLGAVATSDVVLDIVKLAGELPKLTLVARLNPVPVMVTLYPPVMVPETGDTPVTVGVLIVGIVTVAGLASEEVLKVKLPMTGGLVTLLSVIVSVLPAATLDVKLSRFTIEKPPDSVIADVLEVIVCPLVSSTTVALNDEDEKLVSDGASSVMVLVVPRAPEELVLKSMV